MSAEKLVNYTPEMTAELVATYVAEPTEATVANLAEKFGKTVKSVIAKLSREGVYHSKAKETAGKREMTKAEMVADIAKLVGATDEQLESLEKATGPALRMVRNGLVRMGATIVELKVEDAKAE